MKTLIIAFTLLLASTSEAQIIVPFNSYIYGGPSYNVQRGYWNYGRAYRAPAYRYRGYGGGYYGGRAGTRETNRLLEQQNQILRDMEFRALLKSIMED